jgi:FMN-dependent oxidoreductase (nitrilotriacetate monooxygenase family)
LSDESDEGAHVTPSKLARILHLNTNIQSNGRHDAAWKIAEDPRAFLDVAYFQQLARTAERGTLDALFLSDGPVLRSDAMERPWQSLEPTVLLASMAAATSYIGLVATASTTFNDPYNLARRFASLDHISGGRAAWNIVTTYDTVTAANFGLGDLPDHDHRYRRAEEFVEVVVKLWDSWEDGALVADQRSGVFADRNQVHAIDHHGDEFLVRGPLNVPRSPQGRPVLVQAGSSEQGRRLAARSADALFTVQTTFADAQLFYADLKSRASALGRDPDSLTILPGLYPVIGGTEKEALARKAEMDALLDFGQAFEAFAERLGVPASTLSLDNNLTVRQLLALNPGGHRVVIGTPEQVADDMEYWFTHGAADGFNLNADAFPSGLEAIVDHVVPELRRRGIFRTEYAGTTLRDHLGLPRPRSQYELVSAQDSLVSAQ